MNCKQCGGVGKIKKLSKKLNGRVVERVVRCKVCMGTGLFSKKEPRKSDLHAELMMWFKRWIRLKGADKKTGLVKCYTCSVSLPILVKGKKGWSLNPNIQAGHFFHGKLDFDERNLKPQETNCNKWESGNRGIYAANLQDDYGLEIVQTLRTLAKDYSRVKKEDYTKDWYSEQIVFYRNKCLDLRQHFENLYKLRDTND